MICDSPPTLLDIASNQRNTQTHSCEWLSGGRSR
jgi:hypothetical protein